MRAESDAPCQTKCQPLPEGWFLETTNSIATPAEGAGRMNLNRWVRWRVMEWQAGTMGFLQTRQLAKSLFFFFLFS